MSPLGSRPPGLSRGDPRVEPGLLGLRAPRIALRRARVRAQGRVVGRARSGAARLNALTRALAMPALAALLVGLLAQLVIARFRPRRGRRLRGRVHGRRRGRVDRDRPVRPAPPPANRVGALMTWTGFLWLADAFVAANSPRSHVRRAGVEPLPRRVRAPAARVSGRHVALPRQPPARRGGLRAVRGRRAADPAVRPPGVRALPGERHPGHELDHARQHRRRLHERRGRSRSRAR